MQGHLLTNFYKSTVSQLGKATYFIISRIVVRLAFARVDHLLQFTLNGATVYSVVGVILEFAFRIAFPPRSVQI